MIVRWRVGEKVKNGTREMCSADYVREDRRLARIYRCYAPFYDQLFGRLYRSARRRSIASLDLAATDRVFIPCIGTGLDLPELPTSVVVGLDTSAAMLTRARDKPRRGAAELLLGDARHAPFRSAVFDAAILHLALSVVPEPANAFNEVLRVVKPGGRIAVLDKFAPAGRVSSARHVANDAIRWTGTDITRSFDEILDGQPIIVLRSETALLGNYRLILLRRSEPPLGLSDRQASPVSAH